MPAVLTTFLQYRASLFTEPSSASDSAWQDTELDYDFALGSPAPGRDLLLSAPSFPGGRLDWYSFALEAENSNPLATSNPAQVTPFNFNFLPNHVTFRGCHDPRWWALEDSVTDFGQLDAEHVDLSKLLVMEFALVYGNDWFSVPVPAPQGDLSRVTTLVVTDTFGIRTLIRPSEDTVVNPGETPWSMFKLSGNTLEIPTDKGPYQVRDMGSGVAGSRVEGKTAEVAACRIRITHRSLFLPRDSAPKEQTMTVRVRYADMNRGRRRGMLPER